jgi:uncharacterized damage-inducible protein DinB
MEKIIYSLMMQAASTPVILSDLMMKIPEQRLHEVRVAGKWSIYRHLCHIISADELFINRFIQFKNEEHPMFVPFHPNENEGEVLMKRSLDECLTLFKALRSKTLELAYSLAEDDWKKEASHPEYTEYNAHIMMRHIVMHDHLHMYRIEELWLSKTMG